MKKLFTLIALIVLTTINAQAPQGFNYQATVRNAAGDLIINQNVTFKFNIMLNTSTSLPVFSETHYVPTDDLGQVNLTVGEGTATTGTFAAINWGNGNYYLGIELKTGTDFVAMGTTQLLSVPYALYAKTAGSTSSQNSQNVDPSTLLPKRVLIEDNDGTTGASLSTLGNFNSTSYEFFYNGNKIDYINITLFDDQGGISYQGNINFTYLGDLITQIGDITYSYQNDKLVNISINGNCNGPNSVDTVNLVYNSSDSVTVTKTFCGTPSTQNVVLTNGICTSIDNKGVSHYSSYSPFKNITGIDKIFFIPGIDLLFSSLFISSTTNTSSYYRDSNNRIGYLYSYNEILFPQTITKKLFTAFGTDQIIGSYNISYY